MAWIQLILTVLLVNVIPAFAPPTWAVLVYFLVRHDLWLPGVVLAGVTAATLGRYFLSLYIHAISRRILTDRQTESIRYLTGRLGKSRMLNFLFVFLYSLTPLSTSALFIAVGIARIHIQVVLAGFFCGRLISYTILSLSAEALAHKVSDFALEGFSWEGAVTALAALFILLLFTFLDWRSLLEDRRIRWNLPFQ